jgi:hypothetical protein
MAWHGLFSFLFWSSREFCRATSTFVRDSATPRLRIITHVLGSSPQTTAHSPDNSPAYESFTEWQTYVVLVLVLVLVLVTWGKGLDRQPTRLIFCSCGPAG